MREADHIDLWTLVQRPLTPDERLRLVPLTIERAREARARALREFLSSPFRLAARAIAAGWLAGAQRRERRRAIRELNALDDRALHDLGLGRSEIEMAVSGKVRAPRSIVPLRHARNIR
jgi:uncharacterized protein YjiS (DUF1127 family)